MFAVIWPFLLKITKHKLFVVIICKKLLRTFLKTFVSLGTATSGICLANSQGFVSFMPFNVTEMV